MTKLESDGNGKNEKNQKKPLNRWKNYYFGAKKTKPESRGVVRGVKKYIFEGKS